MVFRRTKDMMSEQTKNEIVFDMTTRLLGRIDQVVTSGVQDIIRAHNEQENTEELKRRIRNATR